MDLTDKTINGITLQVSSRLNELNVRHGFTTRHGGVSEGIYSSLNLGYKTNDDNPENVKENYKRVCNAIGTDVSRLVLSKQVHKDNIKVVTKSDIGKGLDKPIDYEADGLVTGLPDVTLAVLGADCLTMILYERKAGCIGAVHSGWRGTHLGIAKKAVEAMVTNYGARAENIYASLGPCISMCCFETDIDVYDAMKSSYGASCEPFIKETGNSKYHVDLKGLNVMLLKSAGVSENNIDVSGDCTMCLPGKYWSHRYTNGRRGIQGAFICM